MVAGIPLCRSFFDTGHCKIYKICVSRFKFVAKACAVDFWFLIINNGNRSKLYFFQFRGI